VDKKTLPIIILLLLCILFYWQILKFLGIYNPPEPSEQPVTTDTIVQQETVQDTQQHPPELQVTEPVTPPDSTLALLADTTKGPIDTIIVETDKYRLALSSKGGGPVSITLKEYTYQDGTPIEMLPEANEPTLDARFANEAVRTEDLQFKADRQPRTYQVSSGPWVVTYTYRAPRGGEIIKRFTFYPDDYHFDLKLVVNSTEALSFERDYWLFWNAPLGVTEPNPKTDYQAMEVVAMQGGSRVKLDDFQDDRLNQVQLGDTRWAGVRNKYFAAVIIPTDRDASAVAARGRKMDVQTAEGTVEAKVLTAGLQMEFGSASSITDSFRVFVGPLDYTLMSKYNVDLQDMLGIGTTPFVGWLIKPFALAVIWLLPKMYSVIPNYGLVIILFALLVKLITLPLSMKSFKSMNAMKELQPKIEALKEKYKKDPQALNREMMAMYKKHGVNPLSGCLPMLPQMPLFFALFSVFRSTILLRQAPFVWFIDDLSRGASSFTDPYIILVVLMVGFQFLSQKLTMASTQQNKMLMYIMPVFMGWIFHSFAAGLVLYWTCFSLLSLLDYVLFKRKTIVKAKAA
jgi:YidC/Oxa1 family membrane protein insertase